MGERGECRGGRGCPHPIPPLARAGEGVGCLSTFGGSPLPCVSGGGLGWGQAALPKRQC
ncbi:hypothetical protein [Azospirillum doebereinerae]